MKFSSLVIILGLLLCVDVIAQKQSESDTIKLKNSIVQLFDLCKKTEGQKTENAMKYYEQASIYILSQSENNKNRCANFNDTKDKESVIYICSKINAFITKHPDFSFGEFMTQQKKEYLLCAYEVKYRSAEKVKTSIFAFAKINNQFMLADIDGAGE